ncbi:hypothetical protein Ntsu_27590 [Nocardia sp. IFM 10818]
MASITRPSAGAITVSIGGRTFPESGTFIWVESAVRMNLTVWLSFSSDQLAIGQEPTNMGRSQATYRPVTPRGRPKFARLPE